MKSISLALRTGEHCRGSREKGGAASFALENWMPRAGEEPVLPE